MTGSAVPPDEEEQKTALGIGPADLVKDLNTMGLFFETIAVRDLRVYSEALDGNVSTTMIAMVLNAML